jgi:multidrug efflux pump
MNVSAPFIRKPIATTLLMAGVGLVGLAAFRLLPVSPLPQVDFPTISVSAQLPGASPQTMASSVAAPLERQLARIAGVTEMTSASSLGSTSITLQLDLTRDIDAAARDVQAAINAARGYLPANLPANPGYRKVNPADSPIMILALTSATIASGQMYDVASTILSQTLSQIDGVGQVIVGGSSLPAVRIELEPPMLNKYGIGLEQVRSAVAATNANTPKGQVSDRTRRWDIGANDQLLTAVEYEPVVVAYRDGAAVRIRDVGQARDSVEDIRTAGYVNGQPAVMLIIFRQPGANIISAVDSVRAALPRLKAAIPPAIAVGVVLDQTVTIRASVSDVERTLLIAVGLVILVVFAFLRNPRTALIPSVAVPLSLLGTFGVMYLLGYSLDNLSLMALTASTGFVVDDAIVVIENVVRHLEQGKRPLDAALEGASEIGFTVLSISVSLVAVFIPLLLMGGIVGRLFREFAVTMAAAVVISMVVSLTATPMMCAQLLRRHSPQGRREGLADRAFTALVAAYGRSLTAVLRFSAVTAAVLAATIALTVYLAVKVPKGFFPQQDTGRLGGAIQADQDTSFQTMNRILLTMIEIVRADPAVANVVGFTGGGGGGTTTNTARLFIALKPPDQRTAVADQVIARLRPALAGVPGATMYLQAAQDVRIGGRQSNAQYQFTMQSDTLDDLTAAGPRMLSAMEHLDVIADVSSDQQTHGLQSMVKYDRDEAARYGIAPQLIDGVLYDAFGQRQVSTIYRGQNQYHVVMEAAPQYWQSPAVLGDVFVLSPAGRAVPLRAFAQWAPATAPLTVTHQGLFPAATISFNLRPGVALGSAVAAIDRAAAQLRLPPAIHTTFAGTAEAYQESLASQPLLIAAALVTVYLVLGILYESWIHPVTILSTLPPAGVGALLALMITRTDLTVIALIGLVLLIGIVKKNAIMMVDFALAAERHEGKGSREAIVEASLLRFRPIIMTTLAAALGALPLALGRGTGYELRRPLGITIIGGLLVSQLLTLYTTPVVYLYFDRLQQWQRRRRNPAIDATPRGPEE